MPKIIENARDQLLAEAKRQIIENGYAATTVRSVAGALGIGVGTVYNYFESKEMLIATFVFEDWKRYLAYMSGLPTDDSYKLLNGIYGALHSFAKENEALFSDPDASRTVSALEKTLKKDFFRRELLAAAVLAEALLALPKELMQSKNELSAKIRVAVKMIEKNISSPPSNRELADACKMELRTFLRRFKQETAESPQQFSRRIRTEKASELL